MNNSKKSSVRVSKLHPPFNSLEIIEFIQSEKENMDNPRNEQQWLSTVKFYSVI